MCLSSFAQDQIQLKGKVEASGEVEGIHIINKSLLKFSITDSDGSFEIPAKINDTILFSGIRYLVVSKIVDESNIKMGWIVKLDEKINELDEVVLGNNLTGYLDTDVENSDIKSSVNFYNLGIPGYTGKQKTQSERRLYEATSGSGLVPLNPILNAISGRTKKLKSHISIERKELCAKSLESKFGVLLFEEFPLKTHQKREFMLTLIDDTNFNSMCGIWDDLKNYEFFRETLISFKKALAQR
jgi:hypothetical protein